MRKIIVADLVIAVISQFFWNAPLSKGRVVRLSNNRVGGRASKGRSLRQVALPTVANTQVRREAGFARRVQNGVLPPRGPGDYEFAAKCTAKRCKELVACCKRCHLLDPIMLRSRAHNACEVTRNTSLKDLNSALTSGADTIFS